MPQGIRHAQEAVLRNDLSTMREAIDNYTRDNKKPLASLQELVDSGYLRQIPNDPTTLKPDWVVRIVATNQEAHV